MSGITLNIDTKVSQAAILALAKTFKGLDQQVLAINNSFASMGKISKSAVDSSSALKMADAWQAVKLGLQNVAGAGDGLQALRASLAGSMADMKSFKGTFAALAAGVEMFGAAIDKSVAIAASGIKSFTGVE
jgi:hypothetical protein